MRVEKRGHESVLGFLLSCTAITCVYSTGERMGGTRFQSVRGGLRLDNWEQIALRQVGKEEEQQQRRESNSDRIRMRQRAGKDPPLHSSGTFSGYCWRLLLNGRTKGIQGGGNSIIIIIAIIIARRKRKEKKKTPKNQKRSSRTRQCNEGIGLTSHLGLPLVHPRNRPHLANSLPGDLHCHAKQNIRKRHGL